MVGVPELVAAVRIQAVEAPSVVQEVLVGHIAVVLVEDQTAGLELLQLGLRLEEPDRLGLPG